MLVELLVGQRGGDLAVPCLAVALEVAVPKFVALEVAVLLALVVTLVTLVPLNV